MNIKQNLKQNAYAALRQLYNSVALITILWN